MQHRSLRWAGLFAVLATQGCHDFGSLFTGDGGAASSSTTEASSSSDAATTSAGGAGGGTTVAGGGGNGGGGASGGGGAGGSEGPVTAIVVNEVMANPLEGGKDWVELYNTYEKPVDIGGCSIRDSDGASPHYAIPGGTTIVGHGYYVVEEAQFVANFGLGKTGDSVHLFDPAQKLLTSATWTTQGPNGQTWGRHPGDGAGGFSFAAPTKGAANQ